MLSQSRKIPSAVAKQDNSESEMASYALPYRKAGIAVMARNVQFCGARCMSAVAVWTVSEALSGLPPLICIIAVFMLCLVWLPLPPICVHGDIHCRDVLMAQKATL